MRLYISKIVLNLSESTHLESPIGPHWKRTTVPIVELGPWIRHGVPLLLVEVPLRSILAILLNYCVKS